jgi:flagellar protein FlgJ
MTYTYDDKIEFAASLYCPARLYAERTGCSWELIIAQAALETGWGSKCLPGSNNIYNIKADPSWHGPKRTYNVPEIINGKKVWVDAEFRLYSSYAECLEDRMRFLEKNPRYRDLMKPGIKGDYEKEAHQLVKSHYATDPTYDEQLITIIRGPSFRRAVARAQTRGCGPLLPAIDILVLDGAKVAIAQARLEVELDGKKAEATTDSNGRLIVRHKLPCGDLRIKVFDRIKEKWIVLDPLATSTTENGQSVTLIAPDFTAQTSTREHEKQGTQPRPAPPRTAETTAGKAPTSSTSTPPPHYKTHKVEKGQSLAKIAALHGVRYQAIAKANGITSPFIIRPDQILKIPDLPAVTATDEHRSPATSKASSPSPLPVSGGGLSVAALGKMLAEGRNELHTLYLRNAQAHPQTDVMQVSRAPWMVPAQKEFEKGVHRRPGEHENDPRILEYFKATPKVGKRAASLDETPYCAAFVNWCLGQAGFKGNGDAWAAAFQHWGRSTRDNKPALGAVAVIRFSGGQHHVTFVAGLGARGRLITTLGGNQGNNHGVTHGHCSTDKVIAYRYPADYPDYDDDYILHDVAGEDFPMTAASTH